jgi:hypothetical protein
MLVLLLHANRIPSKYFVVKVNNYRTICSGHFLACSLHRYDNMKLRYIGTAMPKPNYLKKLRAN